MKIFQLSTLTSFSSDFLSRFLPQNSFFYIRKILRFGPMFQAEFIETGGATLQERKERTNDSPNKSDMYYKAQTKCQADKDQHTQTNYPKLPQYRQRLRFLIHYFSMRLNHNRRRRKLDRNSDILISYTDFKGPSPVLGYSVSLDSAFGWKKVFRKQDWARAGLGQAQQHQPIEKIELLSLLYCKQLWVAVKNHPTVGTIDWG